ncbi:hypothetical protein AQI88_29790 [Streptomyces cellostaticus]|uniref:DUF397 domain-containing protein n=1 Tax=Streptomyces cellostaticus TaxID=67285 RepID=A0A101NH47_9ACTN|nr:DUF397 domain-containing protein [Streptomyces cellostaticus]KUM92882.1 hypothetical protein AQI88_29790 [Streptomyces cellostaticus]
MERVENGVAAHLIPGVTWMKSQHSNGAGDCAEVAPLPDGGMAIRNSRFPQGPALIYTRKEVVAFFAGVKDGEFDFVID